MLFPVSGIEVHPLIPFAVAFFVSFFTSMGGVSGAFLLLPFQVSFLGYTAPSVSATNQVFNIVAIPSGVYRYIREGRMMWPLTWAVIIGTLPGHRTISIKQDFGKKQPNLLVNGDFSSDYFVGASMTPFVADQTVGGWENSSAAWGVCNDNQ